MSRLINFENVVPSQFTTSSTVSTSKSILRKQLVEIQPVELTEFEPVKNSIIRFQASSKTDFISLSESYFRFEVTRTDANNAYTVSFGEGGGHNLFKRITVRSVSGGLTLQVGQDYGVYYALMSNIHDSPEMIRNLGGSYGESIYNSLFDTDHSSEWSSIGTIGYLSLGATPGTFSGRLTLGADIGSRVEIGDTIWAQASLGTAPAEMLGRTYIGEVISFEPGAVPGVINVHWSNEANWTPLTAGVIDIRIRKNRATLNPRVEVVAATNVKKVITLKPLLSIFAHNLPLFVMPGGLEISFELEEAARVFMKSHYDAANVLGAALDYKITQPRMFATMITPSKVARDEITNSWRNGSLNYPIPSYSSHQHTLKSNLANQETSVIMWPACKSARAVYTVHRLNNFAYASDVRGIEGDSHATYPRGKIDYFQYRVGSVEFPMRRVRCDPAVEGNAYEAYEHLKMVSKTKGTRFPVSRMYTGKPYEADAATSHTIDGDKFIMAADLSRDNNGNVSSLTGQDLTQVGLDLIIYKGTDHDVAFGGSIPLLQTFVQYDAYLVLSQDDISVLR